MHITHIIPTLSFGGAERIVVDIINYASDEFDFSVIVFFDTLPLKDQITRSGVDIIRIPKKGQLSLGLVGDIQRVLQKLKPNIVHTHLFGADVWGRLAARGLGIPVLTTEHNLNHDEGWVKCLVKRMLKNLSMQSTACSASVRQYMRNSYGITREIKVIRPGVNLSRFASLKPLVFSSPLRLVIVGRLVEQKGQDIALQALSRIDKKLWRLTIVGNGPFESRLKHLCQKFQIMDNVQFQPAQATIEKIYEAHEVVLVPSRWEGLGIVAMEGLSSGRLVLASRVGGLLEIVQDKVTGILSQPTAQSWQEKIKWVLTHRDESQIIAQQGQKFALDHFRVEAMVEKYEAVYQNMLI